jgi:small-conductance mechanosensitive channel
MSHPIHDVFFLIVLVALWILPALLTARLAQRKGRSFAAFLAACLLIGWPIPLIVALVMPTDRGA